MILFNKNIAALLMILAFSLVVPVVINAQAAGGNTKISGTITAADDGSALPGVNILIKGSTQGTITNSDGKYSIECTQGNVLVFSSIGFITEEVVIDNQSIVDVTLVYGCNQSFRSSGYRLRHPEEVACYRFGIQSYQ